jgi:hypothetical protein
MCHMPCPSHSSWFEHSFNICWRVQNMMLLINLLSTHPSKAQIPSSAPSSQTPLPYVPPLVW